MKVDALSVIEAAYQVDLASAEWIRTVGDAIYAQMGRQLGMLAFDYRVTPDDRLQIGSVWQRDMPPGIGDAMRGSLEQIPDWFVRETYARCDADTMSGGGGSARVRDFTQTTRRLLGERFGWRDCFIVSGIDPTKHGVYFGVWQDREAKLSPRVRTTWQRIAVHLASAHRLQRRLTEADRRSAETADAVLSAKGGLEHAQGDAVEGGARRDLCDAVLGIEHARGVLRHLDVDHAVERWRGLVSGRWTLVDHFESNGDRYILARRNDIQAHGLSALTEREHQALGFAALGHTNKLIGYEMGISPSTVGVLLHRAAQKLGAQSRSDLVARFAALVRETS